ncbi:GNAT family N-acetyltransferase [Veronia nyctiphanis]|uniref:GNAT family N-acetyltransferase n=1 Tax=Veronia nyctiphanis TaxID=1278244 RepID=A0A4Q0YMK7_9GAMM|nr:GNAT family N-acetyltransferase [Veronia nyctiphanis]RXJ70421.1 GNAT family N-acetyltransferase [Veronia nyctiphanis]
MTIRCRVLESGDAASYRELRLESLQLHPESYGSSYEDEQSKPELFFENQIRDKHSKNIMIGAFDNSVLVGLCGLISDELNQFLVVQMYVKEAYKGQGIGQALISEAKSLLIQYQRSRLVLAVYKHNKQALNSYLRAGFQEASRQDNEIVMYLAP